MDETDVRPPNIERRGASVYVPVRWSKESLMETVLSARDRRIIERQFDPRSLGRLLLSRGQKASEGQVPHHARDPVCGRLIETSVEAGTRVFMYRERLYFFCGTTCRDRFVANPKRYSYTKVNGRTDRRRGR